MFGDRAMPMGDHVPDPNARKIAAQSDKTFGNCYNEVKRAFKTSYRKAGLEDWTFHDLRHCVTNNLRLANNNDYLKVMAITGHKTMSTFFRYNLVTEDEVATVVWPQVMGEEQR